MIIQTKNIELKNRNTLMRAVDGPLTSDLLLQPAKFGLGMVPAKLKPDATTNMVCGYCSTGCNLTVHLKNQEAVNLTPDASYPVNLGMACPKGWESLNVLKADNRATTPLLRKDRKQSLQPVEWDKAMREFCTRFKAIQKKHGNESVAFLSTGQITTEEMVLLGSLAKFGMGMTHGDGNTRQCMATAMVAYKESFGFDAPPYTYQDFEESDVIVLIGSNLCVTHPIMWQRISQNQHDPKVIVIDPRKTETAMAASEHLPLAPKSDLALFYGIAHILIQNQWLDNDFIKNHTNGFDGFAEHVQQFPPAVVAKLTGLTEAQLHNLAQTIAEGKRVSFWWTMGVNHSYQGVRTAQSIINLALITGNIGRPGTGANSITGQCNANGSRLFSNTTNLLGGHDFTNEADRQKIADILNIDVATIPQKNSLSYDKIMEGILSGKIKGLWILGTNTAHSWINQNMCHDILDRLDFLVVQDMYHDTETAQLADMVLPAAGWGEKEGTFVNSERRIGIIKKVAKAPGQALSDFSIFKLIAHYWGCREMFADWKEPEDVFQAIKEISRDQPCDITGIHDYRMIDQCGGIQWPCPENGPYKDVASQYSGDGTNDDTSSIALTDEMVQRRLFEDGKFFHHDGRARLVFEMPREMPERPSEKYPYLLLTGRGSAAQWHTQTRTRNSAVLRSLSEEKVYVEINPDDARAENIQPNQMIIVESQRGQIRAKAMVTPTVARGQVFVAMHYRVTNKLTHAHFDPYSKQPSYKDCAVRIRAIESWDE